MKLFLFDIDGTLVRSAGAGRRSMDIAFEDVFGIENGFDGIDMMGRTDPSILREALQNHGMDWKDEEAERFRSLYFRVLREEIEKPRDGKRVCVGIPELLDSLKNRRDTVLGLLTGNWRASADLKLRYFGIDAYFALGAFADDSEDRGELVPVALARAEELTGTSFDGKGVFVIGDTPLDVACAKPHGVKTVGVATGFHAVEELKEAGPDYVFTDFHDTDAVVQKLLSDGSVSVA